MAAADSRPQGIGAFNAAEDLKNAGAETIQQQEAAIAKAKDDLKLAEQMNVPIRERLSLEAQILEKRIALANAEGKSTQQLQMQAASLQIQSSLAQWRQGGAGQIGSGLAQSGAAALVALPQHIGSGIADALLNKHPGKSLGREMAKEMGDLLKNLKNILSTGFTSILKTGLGFLGGFLGFASGGTPPIGVPSLVGERGPELFIPREAGYVVPNRDLLAISNATSSSSTFNSGGHSFAFHVHGVNDPDEFSQHVARRLPTYLRSRSANFTAANR